MTAKNNDKLELALAHFRQGKSPRECEKLTGINYRKVQREADARGYKKGDLSQSTKAIATAVHELVANQVTDEQLDIAKKTIRKSLTSIEALELTNQIGAALLYKLDSMIDSIIDFAELEQAGKSLLHLMRVTGAVAYYPPREPKEKEPLETDKTATVIIERPYTNRIKDV